MDSDGEFTQINKTIDTENSKNIKNDSIFLQDNINRFNEQLFQDNTQQFSRYTLIPFKY
ncbi:Uncharacterized protein FWK35_00023595 [Aphis craccivora]|uniref:Uncharacterized protein n=1 Tax=Aphis craccivora TaxID=307492 RepID=A0A6G0Z200_APHCR|nr:Uncharacterized protein FWK35_00023595 [Aphis craccivora]